MDLASRTVRADLSLNGEPVAIMLDPTRGHALLIQRHRGKDKLLFIDLTSGSLVVSLPLAKPAIDLAINPVTDEAILVGESAEKQSRLTRLSLDTHQIVEEVTLTGEIPIGVAVNPQTTQAAVLELHRDDPKENDNKPDPGKMKGKALPEGRLTLWQLPHPAPILSEISPCKR